MALTPELKKLKGRLEAVSFSKRTDAQKRMLAELSAIDGEIATESLKEARFSSVTKMTSPDGGPCGCCGR